MRLTLIDAVANPLVKALLKAFGVCRPWLSLSQLLRQRKSGNGTEEPIDVTQGWSACWAAADDLRQVQDCRRPKQTVTEFQRSTNQSESPFTGFHASENICWARVTASRPTLSRAAEGPRP